MSATRAAERRSAVALAGAVKLLSRGKYLTVAEIARRMKCSRVSAYERIDELTKRGCKIKSAVMPRESGRPGPDVGGFILVENLVSRKILEAVSL